MTLAAAREAVLHESLRAHEASHAAAALVLGLELAEIRVDRHSGRVFFADPAVNRETALAILAAPLCDPTSETPSWPLLDDDEATQDERQLKQITEWLGYSRADWERLRRDAMALVARRDFCLYERVLESLLHRWPVLRGERLAAVLAHLEPHAIAATP